MTPGFQPFDSERFERHLNAARDYCSRQGYAMTLHSGAEILYTPALANYVSSHRLPTLGESDAVLVEFVPDVAFSEMEEALELFEQKGYSVVLAHVERYACLFLGKALRRIKADFGIQCQMNCHTILERQGLWREHCIRTWLIEGLIDCVASDAHNTTGRPFGMTQAFHALCKKLGDQTAASLVEMTV